MEEGIPSCQIKIDRPIYEHDQLRKDFQYEKAKTSCFSGLCSNCGETSARKMLLKTVPSIKWLAHYKWKNDFVADLIAGFTVAIMHIPQGMAYGLLGNVPPVVGIYMAFFPVLVYFFLGTSRHNSMGTFAVVCLMTGKAVLEHSDPSYFPKRYDAMTTANATNENPLIRSVGQLYSPIEVATAVTLTVALFQLSMYVLRLGAISALLSETLVSGFTTGAAFQVLTSQISHLLGLTIPRHKGFFVVINTLRSVIEEISTINYAAVVISAVTITVTSLNNELLKPALAKKTSFPMPIELLAIVVGTIVSYFFHLTEDYGITTVGEIPSGLPVPTAPPLELISSVLLDGLTIAIVSYSVSLSMALIFAQKLGYEVDANQELLAQGCGNVIGSLFSCMPFTASLSRSSIQQTVGGKTQIASIVSCAILLSVLLWIGPLFETLPKSVLASVIVVALKGMMMQVTALYNFWRLSKSDALIWLVTFLTVVFVSIDIGLLAGVIVSLATIVLNNFKPHTCLLGSVRNTEIYVDVKRYKEAKEIQGIKIFQYSGAINFATRNVFKSELLRSVEMNPQSEMVYRKKLTKYSTTEKINSTESGEIKIEKLQKKVNRTLKCIVLDFSCVNYIDPSGSSTLQQIAAAFQKVDIPIYVAACSEPVFEMISKCGLINAKTSVRIFTTVHDAVHAASDVFVINSANIVPSTVIDCKLEST